MIKDIANEFNIFFCKIGPRLAENIPRSHLDPLYYVTPEKVFKFRSITSAQLVSVLKKMKVSISHRELIKFLVNYLMQLGTP